MSNIPRVHWLTLHHQKACHWFYLSQCTKSPELLKNGLLTSGKIIAWKTCMVCLKFIYQSLNMYPPDNQVSKSYSKSQMFLRLCFYGILRESWGSIMLPAHLIDSHCITCITCVHYTLCYHSSKEYIENCTKSLAKLGCLLHSKKHRVPPNRYIYLHHSTSCPLLRVTQKFALDQNFLV